MTDRPLMTGATRCTACGCEEEAHGDANGVGLTCEHNCTGWYGATDPRQHLSASGPGGTPEASRPSASGGRGSGSAGSTERVSVSRDALERLISEYEAERFTADQNTVCGAGEQRASDARAAAIIAALDAQPLTE